MAQPRRTIGPHDLPHAAHDIFELPPLPAEFRPPTGGDTPAAAYFDPARWDAEMAAVPPADDTDPVETDRGRCDGRATAVFVASDFHMADGTAAGDDFLDSHLTPDDAVGGLYAGFHPAGASRAELFLSALAFGRARLAARVATGSGLDIVLGGDVINGLELTGRGGTRVSRRHATFFRGVAAARASGAGLYWLRGNHDYIVPTGPWAAGEFYANSGLQLLVEHGDRWDAQNWPPGPGNEGSRLEIEVGAAFEVHAGVLKDRSIKYVLAGIDNLRPWSQAALTAFLDRRSKYSDAALLAAALARVKGIGAADDGAAYKGARKRRKTAAYRDWLMVQGHTHVPAAVPGVYYNTGTWITTLIAPKGEEQLVEAFPFLLVYRDRAGQRVEEYFLVGRPDPGRPAVAMLQSAASVDALRQLSGYDKLTGA